MPWSNVPEEDWDKMESCVNSVMGKGHDKDSATAICFSSIVEGKELGAAIKDHVAGHTGKEHTEKSLENDVVSLVTGRIHQAYTVACDELLLRGYLNNEERKAIGGLIGELLGDFQKGIDKAIGIRLIMPGDVDAIAALKEHTETTEVKMDNTPAAPSVATRLREAIDRLTTDLKEALGLKGDAAAHEFRGNQHSSGGGGQTDKGTGLSPLGARAADHGYDFALGGGYQREYNWGVGRVISSAENEDSESYKLEIRDPDDRQAASITISSDKLDGVLTQLDTIGNIEQAQDILSGKEFTQKAGARHSAGDRAALTIIHDKAVELGADCPMVVTKGDDGKYRWTLTSSNAFQDRDREIVSEKAHGADIEVLDGAGEYGPLRWWHVGQPFTEVPGDWTSYKAGPGLDLGQCDFAAMHGRIRIESGTFYDDGVGAAFKEVMDKLSVSQGFSHPLDEPDRDGTFENIHTFERSLLPRGRQSNTLASVGMILKEGNMDAKKKEALVALIGAELVEKQLTQAESTQKDAEEAGLRFKADSKIGEWTASELKDYIQKAMDGPMAELKALFTKADAATPEEMEAMRKKKEAGEALDATVKATGETVTQIADAVNSQADAFKLLSQTIIAQGKRLEEQDLALKSLTGDLPAGVVNGRVGYRPTQDPSNTVSLKDAPPERGNEDFFSWAVRGPGNGSAVGGTPPAPAVPAI